jgi:glycosyltransferase 2 family protein
VNGLLGSIGAFAERFGDVDARFVAIALALQLANLAFRALAWRNVLAAAYPDRRIPLLGIGASYAAGVAANAFLPARGGEAAKVVLARTRIPGSSVPTIAASTSVVLLFDAVAGATLIALAWSLGALPALPGPGSIPAAEAVGGHPVAAAALGLGFLTSAVLVALHPPRQLSSFVRKIGQGGAVLRTPGRYLRTVVSVQAAAWTCRIGVVFFLLAAFGLPATIPTAVLVVVVGGASTLVPVTPGGVGVQQLMLAAALHQTASTASAVSFSIGMQVGVTAVNTAIGLAAMLFVFRTLRPASAAALRAE